MPEPLIPPYPLRWPDGLPRVAKPLTSSPFKTTRPTAIANVEKSLAAFARDSGIKISRIQITSNVGGLRQDDPADAAVSVWFEWDGDMRCIPIDRFSKVEWNLQAIHHLIEADRTKIRYGGLEMVRAAWRGLNLALAAPKRVDWRLALRIEGKATPETVSAAYKLRARELAGRDDQLQLQELNVARDAALKDLGA